MVHCSGWENTRCEGSEHCPPRCPRFFDKEGNPALVREFSKEHREDLIEMYDSIDGRSRAQGIPPTGREYVAEWVDNLTDRGLNLVCLQESRVTGHITATPASAVEPELSVFVHQDFQGSGIGTELLKQLIAYTAADGKEGLHLIVTSGNEQAITVYENIGFELVDQEFMELEMELSLYDPIAERVQRPPAHREG